MAFPFVVSVEAHPYGAWRPGKRPMIPHAKRLLWGPDGLVYLERPTAGDGLIIRSIGGLLPVSVMYDPTLDVDLRFFTANRKYRVVAIRCTNTAVNGGALTAMVRKAASGVAVSAGTALLTAALDLDGAVDTVEVGVLTATSADLDLAINDSLGLDFSAVNALATGVITVDLVPN